MLRRPAVELATGKSRTTIYREAQNGLFVRSVFLGGNIVGWPQHEVEAINGARMAGKSDEDIRRLVNELHKARSET